MSRPVTTGIPVDNHRTTPLSAVAQFAGALKQSEAVDFLWLWDELSIWFPGDLWSTKYTPAAAVVDGAALYDPFVEAAYAAALNPNIGLRLTTDSIRSGPVELLRRMLTLANCTSGPTVCAIGAGELRQTKPFGYKRSEGIKRLEDTFVLVRKLYDSLEPFSYEGNFWNYKNAFIGGARPAIRPEFWALGGGPVLLDIAAKHADGFEAAVPHAISSPDKFAKIARMLREKVEGYGRDPDKFGMGIWFICISHEDPEVIEKVLDSPLIRFFAALSGRMDATEWIAEGMTPPMPEGWHYANSWSPCEQTVDEVNGIVSRVPKEMARKSFYCGTPDQLAKISRQYIDAGADFVGLLDYTPLVLGPADGMASVQRGIKIFRSQK